MTKPIAIFQETFTSFFHAQFRTNSFLIVLKLIVPLKKICLKKVKENPIKGTWIYMERRILINTIQFPIAKFWSRYMKYFTLRPFLPLYPF